jgi:hypothetical protein
MEIFVQPSACIAEYLGLTSSERGLCVGGHGIGLV